MPKRRATYLALFVALVIVGAAAAWWGIVERKTDILPGASAERELVVGLADLGEINTLDPARAATAAPVIVLWQIYDRLVTIEPDGTLSPGLASGWQSSDDLKEWRFQIRPDAQFHAAAGETSRAVTPMDVRASIERALRIPGFSQTLLGDLVLGAQEFIKGETEHLQGLDVESGEVVFRLARPFAFLPERLASSFFSIVPEGTPIQATDPPVGSGPYRLVAWDQIKHKIVLEKTEHPWAPPTLSSPERLVIHVFPSAGVAVEELMAGTLDWLETTAAALPLLESSTGAGDLRIETSPQTDLRLVALNMKRAEFAENPALGAALNYATNREEIVRALGGGRAVGGPIPGYPGFDFDPGRARALIAEIPPQAREIELLVLPGQQSRTMAELLKKQWGEIGVDVTLRLGLADFFERVVQGNYQMALAYYGPFIPSPEQYLWPYRMQAQPVPNVMGFSSEAFERAYDTYVSTGSDRAREKSLADALKAITGRPPAVWLVQVPGIAATSTDLTLPRAGSIPLFNRMHPAR